MSRLLGRCHLSCSNGPNRFVSNDDAVPVLQRKRASYRVAGLHKWRNNSASAFTFLMTGASIRSLTSLVFPPYHVESKPSRTSTLFTSNELKKGANDLTLLQQLANCQDHLLSAVEKSGSHDPT